MTTLFDLDTLEVPRREQIESCASAAVARGWDAEAVSAVVLEYLSAGPSTAENIVAACKRAGHVPHDDRAFGAVFVKLSRAGLIRKAGYAPRFTGNVEPVWEAAK